MDTEENTSRGVRLQAREFRRLAEFIQGELGIKMPDVKLTMIEARLQKRLRTLEMQSFAEYIEFVFSPAGEQGELINMIDVVTTNKTDFFREPSHFEHLVKHALPALERESGAGTRRPLGVWSAGCSTGEEPYTLGMVLDDYGTRLGQFDFFILATDISTRVLHAAQAGIYDQSKLEPVPPAMMKRYVMRSKDRSKQMARIVPELRERVHFRRINFMDEDFGFRERMDVIFCRNVVIYFDRPTQERLLNKFARHLEPGGFLFMGHSETITGLDVPFRAVGSTVYRRI